MSPIDTGVERFLTRCRDCIQSLLN